MDHHQCLNCQTPLISHYCHHCGQKAATHRITPGHFLAHDLLHGLWHIDKGLLYTLKELFIRPGATAAAYISGKRIRYYNFFYLLLLVLGLNILTVHLFTSWYGIEEAPRPAPDSPATLDATEYLRAHVKLIIFLLIPFFAVNGAILFRRLRYNIAEHAILAANAVLTGATWSLVFFLVFYASYYGNAMVWDLLLRTLLTVIALTPVLVYYQVARKSYRLPGFAWRMILWYALFFGELLALLLAVLLPLGKTSIVFS